MKIPAFEEIPNDPRQWTADQRQRAITALISVILSFILVFGAASIGANVAIRLIVAEQRVAEIEYVIKSAGNTTGVPLPTPTPMPPLWQF